MSELETSIKYLKGIGERRAISLKEVGVETFEDFIHYYPRKYLDRRKIKSIGALLEGEETTVVGEVWGSAMEGSRWKNSRFSVLLTDNTSEIKLVWFRGANYLKDRFKKGDVVAAHGKVGVYGRGYQLLHPEVDIIKEAKLSEDDIEVSDYELFNTGGIVSLYPTTEKMKRVGLTTKAIRRSMKVLLSILEHKIENIFSEETIKKYHLIDLRKAYQQIHFPDSNENLNKAKHTLKWVELFLMQYVFALRYSNSKKASSSFKFNLDLKNQESFSNKLSTVIPFDLTNAQKRAIKEIRNNMATGFQMNRLLQGDVGSGKTIVAVSAIVTALDNGTQCAFMAPTEILATQHFFLLKKLLEPIGIVIILLVGKMRKKLKEEILTGIRQGITQVVVGTHAIIENEVEFDKLGLIIIDEQHRFGVLQRKALQDKADMPHVLLMTATPIPRTLSMTVYGDLDVSTLDEFPKNRKPVQTKILHETDKDQAYEFIRSEIQKGRQAYIVYPLVEESEKIDLNAATMGYEKLQNEIFTECKVGLIHGKLFPYEKEEEMNAFRDGKTRILVGTTVIEVGIDVANASVMMIEHAERFGLSQLHQLRGRVGRGTEQSYVFLIYYGKLTQEAKTRLLAIEETTDGFKLSEVDMELRGAGNILGTAQSGIVQALKIASLIDDRSLLDQARIHAFSIVEQDAQLRLASNQALRRRYLRYFKQISVLLDVG